MPSIELALIICKQGSDREKIIASALKCRLSPICCCNLEEARTLLPQDEFRMVLCSESLRDGDFRAVLRETHKSTVQAPVIVFGLSCDWDSYLRALAAGAFDYIVCPPNPIEVEKTIWHALADAVDSGKASGAAA